MKPGMRTVDVDRTLNFVNRICTSCSKPYPSIQMCVHIDDYGNRVTGLCPQCYDEKVKRSSPACQKRMPLTFSTV